MANPASIENFSSFFHAQRQGSSSSSTSCKNRSSTTSCQGQWPTHHQCSTGKTENPANPSSLKDLFRIQGWKKTCCIKIWEEEGKHIHKRSLFDAIETRVFQKIVILHHPVYWGSQAAGYIPPNFPPIKKSPWIRSNGPETCWTHHTPNTWEDTPVASDQCPTGDGIHPIQLVPSNRWWSAGWYPAIPKIHPSNWKGGGKTGFRLW